MTILLESAIQQAELLPPDKQDWMAQMMLDVLKDEAEWDRQFAASQDVIALLVEEAKCEYHAGRVWRLNS